MVPPGTLQNRADTALAPVAQQVLLPKEGEGKSPVETELNSGVKILPGVLSHGECRWEEMHIAPAPSTGHKITFLTHLCLLEDVTFVHTGLWGEMGSRT